MRPIALASLLVLGACATTTVPATAESVDLVVRFDGLEARGGSLRVGLFDSAEGFALRGDGVIAERTVAAEGGSVVVRFDGLPPGRYGITAFHDANDNNQLDRALGLVPQEGVALSNDPPLIGSPSFDDIAVEVLGNAEVAIRVRYLAG